MKKEILPKPLIELIIGYCLDILTQEQNLLTDLYMKQIITEDEVINTRCNGNDRMDVKKLKFDTRADFYDRISPTTNLPYPLVYMIIDYLFG